MRLHFSKQEWDLAGGGNSTWKGTKTLRKYPIDLIESCLRSNCDFLQTLAADTKNLKYMSTYIWWLGYYQRIDLDLDYVLERAHTSASRYPIAGTPNFQIFSEIVQGNYHKLFHSMDIEPAEKASRIEIWNNLIVKFWIAGYGVLPGLAANTIDNSSIKKAFDRANRWVGKEKSVRLLAKLLEYESSSPVNKPEVDKRFPKIRTFYDREQDMWKTLLEEYPNDPAVQLLHSYVFSELAERFQKQVYRKYADIQGTERVEVLRQLKPVTWFTYSGVYRSIAPFLIGHPLSELFEEAVFHEKLAEIIRNIGHPDEVRIHIRSWLHWLNKTQGIALSPDILVPEPRKRRRDKEHGKILDISAAAVFINHLLNFTVRISRSRIKDFRIRRIVLIMLATGARLSSVLCLKRNCIMYDKLFHMPYIHFHSTKTEVEYEVSCDDDLVRWVEELKEVAPKNKLCFSNETSQLAGDGLTTFRLVANATDDGPLTKSDVQNWLIQFQKKIWPNGSHPNGDYFEPHDMRRLMAEFLKIQGCPDEMIQYRLGQVCLNSTLTYTATGDPKITEDWFALSQVDIYSLSDSQQAGDISLEDVMECSLDLKVKRDDAQRLLELVESAFKNTQSAVITSGDPILEPAPRATGHAHLLNGCCAPETYNCRAGDIHCFACPNHSHDKKKIETYKAIIFREMINCLHHSRLLKQEKDTFVQEMIFDKVDGPEGLKTIVGRAFDLTFIERFEMPLSEAKKLEKELWKQANSWYKTKIKTMDEPMLNQDDAVSYLQEMGV